MKGRQGFTMLELLLATVLSVLLMIGVLAVVTRLGASKAVDVNAKSTDSGMALQAGPDEATIDAWVWLLRHDLNHARGVDGSQPNVIEITGYFALDRARREQTHRPVRINYVVEQIDGRPWLVRREMALDVLTNQNVRRELLCVGVSRFELVQSSGAAGGLVDSSLRHAQSHEGEAQGGAIWRLRVWSDQGTKPTYDRIVTVRHGGAL